MHQEIFLPPHAFAALLEATAQAWAEAEPEPTLPYLPAIDEHTPPPRPRRRPQALRVSAAVKACVPKEHPLHAHLMIAEAA